MGFYYLYHFNYMHSEEIMEDFEDWKPLLQFIMKYKLLDEENKRLKDHIRHLESQVYGGTTK